MYKKWAACCLKCRWWFINTGHWHSDLGLREWYMHKYMHSLKTSRFLGLLTGSLCMAGGWALRKVGRILLQTARDSCAGLCETVLLFLNFYLSTLTLPSKNKTKLQSPSNHCCYFSLFPLHCLLGIPPALSSYDWHLGLTKVWAQLRQLSSAYVLTVISPFGACLLSSLVADCSIYFHLLWQILDVWGAEYSTPLANTKLAAHSHSQMWEWDLGFWPYPGVGVGDPLGDYTGLLFVFSGTL